MGDQVGSEPEQANAGEEAAEETVEPIAAPKPDPADGILECIFLATTRLVDLQEGVTKKIRIGRDRMAKDAQSIKDLLDKAVMKIEKNPAFAPEPETKDLASNGYVLQQLMKVSCDEHETERFASVLIQSMSSRRITFEFENYADKAELIERLKKSAGELGAFIQHLRTAR